GSVIAALTESAFIARPAKILYGALWVRNMIDFFPFVPSDVSNPNRSCRRINAITERVSKSISNDAIILGVAAAGERISGESLSGIWIKPQDGAGIIHR